MSRYDELEELGGQAHSLVVGLAGKARGISFLLFVVVAVTAAVGYLLGVIATSGGWRLIWILVGGWFAVVGVGAGFRSWRGLNSVLDQAGELKSSFVGLLGSADGIVGDKIRGEDVEGMSLLKRAKLTRSLRKSATSALGQYRDVAGAMAAVGSFPAMAGTAIIATIGFSFFAVVFFISLAF